LDKSHYKAAGLFLAGVVCAGFLSETQQFYRLKPSDEHPLGVWIDFYAPQPHPPHAEYDTRPVPEIDYNQTGVANSYTATGTHSSAYR